MNAMRRWRWGAATIWAALVLAASAARAEGPIGGIFLFFCNFEAFATAVATEPISLENPNVPAEAILKLTLRASKGGTSCGGFPEATTTYGNLSIDWGDGAGPQVYEGSPAYAARVERQFSRVYRQPGIYLVKLNCEVMNGWSLEPFSSYSFSTRFVVGDPERRPRVSSIRPITSINTDAGEFSPRLWSSRADTPPTHLIFLRDTPTGNQLMWTELPANPLDAPSPVPVPVQGPRPEDVEYFVIDSERAQIFARLAGRTLYPLFCVASWDHALGRFKRFKLQEIDRAPRAFRPSENTFSQLWPEHLGRYLQGPSPRSAFLTVPNGFFGATGGLSYAARGLITNYQGLWYLDESQSPRIQADQLERLQSSDRIVRFWMSDFDLAGHIGGPGNPAPKIYASIGGSPNGDSLLTGLSPSAQESRYSMNSALGIGEFEDIEIGALTADGRSLFLASNRAGSMDIYLATLQRSSLSAEQSATVTKILNGTGTATDANGDGVIDAADLITRNNAP